MAGMADYLLPGASIVSSLIGSNAAGDAADAQRNAAREAIAAQQAQWREVMANLSPWMSAGGQAQNRLALMMGLKPSSTPTRATFDPAAYLEANPDVKADSTVVDPFAHYLQYGQGEGRKLSLNALAQPDYTQDPYYNTGVRPNAGAYSPQNANAFRMAIIGR